MSIAEKELLVLVEKTKKATVKRAKVEKALAIVNLATSLPFGATAGYLPASKIVSALGKQTEMLALPTGICSVSSLITSLTSEIALRYEDNRFLQHLNKAGLIINKGLLEFFISQSLSWQTLQAITLYIGGVETLSNETAKIAIPIAAIVPAALVATLQYRSAVRENNLNRSYTRHTASFFKGATSTGWINTTLVMQNILPLRSSIPSLAALANGLLLLMASLFKEYYPKVSKTLVAISELIGKNPTLAVALLNFPMDIYAAEHHDQVPDSYFYSDVSISATFYMLLTLTTALTLFSPAKNQLQLEEIIEKYEESGQDVEDGSSVEVENSSSEDYEEEYVGGIPSINLT